MFALICRDFQYGLKLHKRWIFNLRSLFIQQLEKQTHFDVMKCVKDFVWTKNGWNETDSGIKCWKGEVIKQISTYAALQ